MKRVIPEAIATTEQGAPSIAGSSPAAANPRMSILIVTHAKDAEWLNYCVASIDKFASHFSEVVIVCPEGEQDAIYSKCGPFKTARVVTFDQAPAPLGHLHQNLIKCHADELCPKADYVLHMDSDCIFKEPVTPLAYLEGYNPVILIKRWAKMEAEKQTALCWRAPTDKALGFPTTHETMQRIPMVYRRGLYPLVRRHIENLHGMAFDSYVLGQRPQFPYGFSEFNALSSYALRYCPEFYHFIDVGDCPHPPNPMYQYWSHAAPTVAIKVWREGRLVDVVPIEEIKRILEL